jgi:GNAT superfamily N-acetyltransferase
MATMEIRIREAGVEDLGHILRHRQAMFEEMGYREERVLERVEELSREYFSKALGSGAYRAWLAEDEMGQVVGGGGLVIADWPGYPRENHAKRVWILNMYTEPRVRRCGVAKRLMETMIESCRAQKFTAVSLHASAAGRLVYEKLGFAPTNEMRLTLR